MIGWLVDAIAAKLLYRRVGIAHKNVANSSFNGGPCPPYIDLLKSHHVCQGFIRENIFATKTQRHEV